MAFAATGTNNKMESRFSEGGEQVLRDLFCKEVYANFELRDPRQMKVRFGSTHKKYTTHVPLGPTHKQTDEPAKPRPTGKGKGRYATSKGSLANQAKQIAGVSGPVPQHKLSLESLNAGILRQTAETGDRTDKADLGMFYSKAEYQDLEKATQTRPQRARQTKKANAHMRKKMTEKDAVMTMKGAREEGRAAPSKIVALMRDWINVERLQWDGCCAIWQAASENAQAREELGFLGATDALVQAMERYPDSEQIIERACWAMTALAFDNPSNAALLGRAACHEVAEALRRHRESVTVSRRVLAAIAALCKHSADNRQALRELNVDDTLRVEFHLVKEKNKWTIQNSATQKNPTIGLLARNAIKELER